MSRHGSHLLKRVPIVSLVRLNMETPKLSETVTKACIEATVNAWLTGDESCKTPKKKKRTSKARVSATRDRSASYDLLPAKILQKGLKGKKSRLSNTDCSEVDDAAIHSESKPKAKQPNNADTKTKVKQAKAKRRKNTSEGDLSDLSDEASTPKKVRSPRRKSVNRPLSYDQREAHSTGSSRSGSAATTPRALTLSDQAISPKRTKERKTPRSKKKDASPRPSDSPAGSPKIPRISLGDKKIKSLKTQGTFMRSPRKSLQKFESKVTGSISARTRKKSSKQTSTSSPTSPMPIELSSISALANATKVSGSYTLKEAQNAMDPDPATPPISRLSASPKSKVLTWGKTTTKKLTSHSRRLSMNAFKDMSDSTANDVFKKRKARRGGSVIIKRDVNHRPKIKFADDSTLGEDAGNVKEANIAVSKEAKKQRKINVCNQVVTCLRKGAPRELLSE